MCFKLAKAWAKRRYHRIIRCWFGSTPDIAGLSLCPKNPSERAPVTRLFCWSGFHELGCPETRLAVSDRAGAFIPLPVTGAGNRLLFVRTAADPLRLSNSIQREIWAVDPGVPLVASSHCRLKLIFGLRRGKGNHDAQFHPKFRTLVRFPSPTDFGHKTGRGPKMVPTK
jgi:hypothetical protein